MQLRSLLRFQAKAKSIKIPNPNSPPYPTLSSTISHFNSLKIPHIPNQTAPTPSTRNILITSALPYVNNTPHLGNIIGAVLSADVYARYCRLRGHNVLYLCGTDEYGTATQIKALKDKCSPKEICDKYFKIHKEIYDWFDISFDHFGRTSKDVHTRITQQIFTRVHHNGNIKENTITQFKCQQCDLFLADRFVHGMCRKCGEHTNGDQCDSCGVIITDPIQQLIDPKCQVCSSTPVPTPTTHLFLQLHNLQGALEQWLAGDTMRGWSNNAKGMTTAMITSGLRDRCITRDLKWGVPVPLPNYQQKVFYVWFEAVLGYLSITADYLGDAYQLWWATPENRVELKQFMGKDNILFHSIISPCTLIATGKQWTLPKTLAVTDYLLYEGGKFSKSKGVGVFGDSCSKTKIPSEVWRYYLLANRPQSLDSEFTWADFAQKCNDQLMDSIGNLFNRVLRFCFKEYGTRIPSINLLPEDQLLIAKLTRKRNELEAFMEEIQIKSSMACLLEISHILNKYAQDSQFWKHTERREGSLGLLVRCFRVYSLLLEPFLPSASAKINYLIGIENRDNRGIYQQMRDLQEFIRTAMQGSSGIREPILLVQEITTSDLAEYIREFGGKSECIRESGGK